jgi:DNA repair exonuclease SbcCD nuclease subunit
MTGGKDILLVHSSDLHVDDGFTARVHDGEGTRGLRAVLATARALSADVVLLAGDVFEHNRLSDEIVAETARLVAKAAMPVVLLPGNHDPALDDSEFYGAMLERAANLRVLGVSDEETVSLPALDLDVWGRAHRRYGDMLPLENPRPRAARWHVAIAHGHYHPNPMDLTPPRPAWLIGDDHIAATSADYVALGHWNQAIQVGNGSVPAYYSGSPEFAGTVNAVRLTSDGTVVVAREAIRWD